LLAIRSGEGRLVGLLAGLFASIEVARGLGEISVDALFVSRVGAEFLPYLYVALGVVTLVVAIAYGAGIGRLPRRTFLAAGLVASSALVLLERAVLAVVGSSLLPVVWLTVAVMNTILLTVVWTVGTAVLDTRQAKRLLPICTGAAIAGAFGGTLAAGPLARLVGVENVLVLQAAAILVAAGLTFETLGRFGSRARPARAAMRGASLVADLRAGYDHVRRSPLMRLVAVSYVLFSVLFFFVSFPFYRALRQAYPSEVEFATVLGLLSAGVTGIAFLISIAVANRLFTRFGVAAAALMLPLVYVAGFGLWLVQFGVTTAIAFRASQQVAQRGISNAAWGALFNVVPIERRAQVIAFMDGLPSQLGTSLSGLLLLGVGFLAPSQLFAIGLAVGVALAVVVLRIRRQYGEELLASLRAGLAEQVLEGGPGLEVLARDPQCLVQLRSSLADPSPPVRRLSAELLGRLKDREAAVPLVRLLDDPEPEVRAAGLIALDKVGKPAPADWVERSLADPSPKVRAAAVRAAARGAHRGGASWEPLARLDDDPSPLVRAELAVALVAIDRIRATRIVDNLLESPAEDDRVAGLDALARIEMDPSRAIAAAREDRSARVRAAAVATLGAAQPTDAALAATIEALDDEAATVREAAATALRRQPRAASRLARLLDSGSQRTQGGALVALAGLGGEARDGDGPDPRRPDVDSVAAVRGWASRQLERATLLRAHSAALADRYRDGDKPATNGPGLRGSVHPLLASVIAARQREVEHNLLMAFAVLGAPEATGPIRRSLRSNDADIRAQAIEAIDAIGDPALGRSFVRFLDAETEPGRGQPGTALGVLTLDPDPWIRGLALRLRIEELSTDWQATIERVSADPDPVVQLAVDPKLATGGPTMPQTSQTLGEVDRMLFLRTVPIFSQLSPEDLQRIGAAATERLYPAGEALVTEGDIGDELIVIAEGRVRVVQGEGESARVVRTYTVGDHIGELAVLTDRPRAATVVAEESVRGLVIGGESVRAILQERPSAAMAMLATLAERIGSQ
jgi:HEAT repeat protein